MKPKTNKATAQSRNQKLIAALSEHFKSSDVLTLGGTSYKAKELQKMLQDQVDALNAADAIVAKWHTAVSNAYAKAEKVTGVLPALRTYLINAYGASSQVVADFNFTPKARTTTIKAQAAGIAKRTATRKARGTMGAKQKAEITGDVSPVTLAPATSTAGTSTPESGEQPKTAATS